MKKAVRFFSGVLMFSLAALFSALLSPAAQAQVPDEYGYDGNNKISYMGYRQAPNFDFEGDWQDKEPWGWNSSNCYEAALVASDYKYYQSVFRESGTVRPGSSGNYCMKIQVTVSDWQHFRLGSLFPVRSYVEMGTLTTGKLHYYDEKKNSDSYIYTVDGNKDGDGEFRWSFTQRPDSIVFWAWSQASKSGRSNVTLYLHDKSSFGDHAGTGGTAVSYQDPNGLANYTGSYEGGTAIGYVIYDIPNTSGWVRYSLPVKYLSDDNPSNLLLSFTAGPNFRQVQEGDVLYIDDVMFVYTKPGFNVSGIEDNYNRYRTDPLKSIDISYSLQATMEPFSVSNESNQIVATLSDKNGNFNTADTIELGRVTTKWVALEANAAFHYNIPDNFPSSDNYKIRVQTTNYPVVVEKTVPINHFWRLEVKMTDSSHDGRVYGQLTCNREDFENGWNRKGEQYTFTVTLNNPATTQLIGWRDNGVFVPDPVPDRYSYTVTLNEDHSVEAVFDTLFTVSCEQVPGSTSAVFHLDDTLIKPVKTYSSLTVRKSADTTAMVHFSVPEGFAFHGFLLNQDTVHVYDPGMKTFYNNLPDNYLYSFKVSGDAVIKPLIDTLVYPQRFKVASKDDWSVADNNLGSITGVQNVYKHFDTLRVTARPVNEFSHFRGWYDSAAGGDPITVDTLLKLFVRSSVSYIASFEEEKHNVSVSVNDAVRGSAQLYLNDHAESSPQNISAVYENRVRITAAAKTGYAFQYWEVKQVFPSDKGLPEVNTTWTKRDTTFVNGHITADYTFKAVFDTSRHSLRISKRLESLPDSETYYGHNSGFVTGGKLYTGGKTGYKYGDSVMLTAKADSGYYFVRWDIPSLPDSVQKRDTVWVQIFSDTVFKALFEVKTYRVEVTWNAGGNLGYVTPNTSNDYKHFTPVKFISNPKPFGELRYWVINSDTLSEAPTYTMTITDSAKVHAIFSYRRCKVTVACDPANNGTVEVNGVMTTSGNTWIFEWGTKVSFKAWVDDDGYEFKGWRTTGGGLIPAAAFTIDSLITDTALTALFPAKLFTVSVFQFQNFGWVFVGDTSRGMSDSTVGYTQPVQITAVPYESYEFEGWYASSDAGAVRISTKNPESFNMPKKDTLIYARFRDLRYEINLTAVPKLGGKLTGGGMYTKPKETEKSTIVKISAQPNSGYEFIGWYKDTVKIWDNVNHSFPLDTGVYLIARFREMHAPLHVKAEPAYAVDTLTGNRLYYQDYNARVYADVKKGYQLEYWRNEKGEILSDKNPYLFAFNVTDTVITAVLQPKALNVDFAVEPYVSGYADMPVCRYNVPTVATAVPEYGYGFVCWKYADGSVINGEDGKPVGAGLTILSTVDTAFTMVFAPLRYGVEIEYDTTGGTVSGNDSTYEYMSYAPLRAEPGAHRIFTGWYAADGSLLSADTALDLRITAPTRVEARFERKPTFSMMKVEPPMAGYITNDGVRVGDTLHHGCGEPMFLEAVAFEGYEFSGWRIVKDGDTNMMWFLSKGLSLEDSSYVTAMFDTLWYYTDVTVADSGRGTVSGDGFTKHGQNVCLRAEPVQGYDFICYKERHSGRLLSYDSVYTFRSDSSIDITAVFDTARYKLWVMSADSGAVLYGGGYYKAGETAPLSAWHLDLQKAFAYWSKRADGKDTLSRVSAYGYKVNRPGDDTVYAFYDYSDMRVVLKTNHSQYGTAKGGGLYVAGSTAMLTAQPSYGYHLDGWYENGFPTAGGDTLYLEVNSDREIEAVFVPNRYTVKLVAVIEADSQIVVEGVEMHGAGEYEYGQTYYIEMSAVPFGYTFVAWKAEDGNVLSVNSAYSRVAQMSRTIYAVLAKQQFAVTGKITGDGTVSGGGLYAKGERAVLQAAPRQHWKFEFWRLGGKFYSSSARIELDVYDNVEAEAVFAWDASQPLPNVAMEGAGGVYIPVSKGGKDADDRVLLRAVPNAGYDFLYWTFNGDSILSRDLDCEVLVSATPFITAHFQKSIYQVRMMAVGEIDGAVSLSGTGSYRYGENVTLKVVLKEGYKLDGWYRNVEGGFVFVSGDTEAVIDIEDSMDLEVRISKE